MYYMGRTTGNDYLGVFGLLFGATTMIGLPVTIFVTMSETRGGWWEVARYFAGLWVIFWVLFSLDYAFTP